MNHLYQTGSYKLVRSINGHLVLNLIREHQKISGSELSKMTGMRPSTISSLLKELEGKNLIVNTGKGESTSRGGKRPFLWRINNTVAYVIGVDVEIGVVTSVLMDLDGKIVYKAVNTFKSKRTKNDLISNIEVSVNEVLYKSCISTEKILGMGIAVAGIVDYQTGVIKITDLLPKIDFDISSIFKEKYSFPTFVENNANAASIGAKWVGPAIGVNNFMTVLIEVGSEVGGLGLGIIINGKIYHGFSFCSGELDVQLPTITGILGHLRHKMVKGTYFHKFQNQVRKITLHHLVNAAKLEDVVAIQYFQKLGHVIGKAIASPIALLNPELVVITGKIAGVGAPLLQSIRREVQLHTLDITNQAVRFGEHPYGSFSVSIGAASLILDDFFKVPIVQQESSF